MLPVLGNAVGLALGGRSPHPLPVATVPALVEGSNVAHRTEILKVERIAAGLLRANRIDKKFSAGCRTVLVDVEVAVLRPLLTERGEDLPAYLGVGRPRHELAESTAATEPVDVHCLLVGVDGCCLVLLDLGRVRLLGEKVSHWL
jgi:hypothetical protein